MKFIVLSLCLTRLVFAAGDEKRGLEVATMIDKANEGFGSEKSDMVLELINAHGDTTKRKMRMELLEGKEDGDKSLSVFDWPADVKGTKLLTHTHKKSDDDQWLYLPAVKRVKRISSNNKSGSFMGSEFAYEDLNSQEIEKFRHYFVREEKLNGRDCYVLERTPTDGNSGYKHLLTWIDKEYLAPAKIEYYDRKDELLKISQFSAYQKIGKFWRWGKIACENVQTKKRSVLTWENRHMAAAIDTKHFDSSTLED